MKRMLTPIAAVALAAPLVLLAFSAPAGAASVECAGHRATIVGRAGDEVLNGTPGADVIAGLKGGDTIHGNGGNDIICGGYGSDHLYGGAGNDRVYGGRDRLAATDDGLLRVGDFVVGGPGDDRLVPGFDPRPADDALALDAVSWDKTTHGVRIDIGRGVATGEGRDTFVSTGAWVIGSNYSDRIDGGPGDDLISGGRGSDRLAGHGGDDQILADDATTGGRGVTDTVTGGAGDDQLSSWFGVDDVAGGPGDDSIDDTGGTPDTLRGGPGDDLIVYDMAPPAGAHHASLAGGIGHDKLDVFSNKVNPSGGAATGTWNMATGAMTFDPGQAITLAASGFEEGGLSTFGASTWTVRGTSGPDIIRVGNGDGTKFTGLGGDDSFLGTAGDDTFNGGPGTDHSLGMGVGDDTCNSVEVFDFDDCEHVVA